jgi:hypothetical protein
LSTIPDPATFGPDVTDGSIPDTDSGSGDAAVARLEAALRAAFGADTFSRLDPLISADDTGPAEAHIATQPPLSFREAWKIGDAYDCDWHEIRKHPVTPGAGEIRVHGPAGTLVVIYAGGAE